MLFIFLKAWQQQNITHAQYLWIVPTSLAMSSVEFYVIAQIAKTGYSPLVVAIGLGAGLGALAATYLHRRMINK